MPRYFFDLYNGSGLTRDEEGQELPDQDAARASALNDIRSLLSSEIRAGSLDLRGRIMVRPAAGGEPAEVLFVDAVRFMLP